MRPAVEAEKVGIPSVVIATSGFATLARLTSVAGGIDDMRIAEYPGAIGIHSSSEIAGTVRDVLFARIIEGLTGATGTSNTRVTGTAKYLKDVVFTGTFNQVNSFYRANEWTDGLPIVPPTLDRVQQFLQYTNHSPEAEIASLSPANLKAVPWNIAVNAVMAGCQPEHVPLIIAAVEALGDEKFNMQNMGSTSGLVPYILVNGPIVGQLGIEFGGQLVSKGPNPAIGRAIGLIVRNIAGYHPGRNYMGTFGYPLPFTLAENDNGTPWPPFHVEHGFDRSTSTVTVGVTNNWGHAPAPARAPDKTGAQITLELLCKELAKRVRLYGLQGEGEKAEKVMITIVVSPPVAKALADAGYSKQDVRQYLYENARAAGSEFEWAKKYTGGGRLRISENSEPDRSSRAGLASIHDMRRLLPSSEVVHIIVCGDANRNRVMLFEGGHAEPTTRAITLPPDWDALLKEVHPN